MMVRLTYLLIAEGRSISTLIGSDIILIESFI
jgi:hypothetical protein